MGYGRAGGMWRDYTGVGRGYSGCKYDSKHEKASHGIAQYGLKVLAGLSERILHIVSDDLCCSVICGLFVPLLLSRVFIDAYFIPSYPCLHFLGNQRLSE